MKASKQRQRVIYTLVAINSAVMFIAAALFVAFGRLVFLLVCFPVLLTFNVICIRRMQRSIPIPYQTESTARSRRRWLQAASTFFVVCALYGLLLFLSGQLPLKVLPVLAVPLFMAIVFLKESRRGAPHGSENPATTRR